MKKENKTVYIILGFLNHEELTGYEIKKRIDSSLSFFWGAGFGQIYPTLNQMYESGLVLKRSDSRGQKLERIIYSITELGIEQLKGWLAAPIEKEIVRYEILLKLFFGSLLTDEENIKNIKSFQGEHMKQLATLSGFEGELKGIVHQSPDHLYYLLAVLFGKKVNQAYLEWADEAVALLKQAQINN